MKIIDADAYLDGGTSFVVIDDDGVSTRFELDYSLPRDGRPRHVTVSTDHEKRVLAIGSKEETDACSRIKALLEEEYGATAVRDALNNAPAREIAMKQHFASQGGPLVSLAGFNDPHPLPFDTHWFFVFYFVRNAVREGKL